MQTHLLFSVTQFGKQNFDVIDFFDKIDLNKYAEFKKCYDWFLVTNGIEEPHDFKHEFLTCLGNINDQIKHNCKASFRYGLLCITEYQNNSCPNLVEFGICLPMYTNLNK